MLDPVSLIVGAIGGMVTVLALTWATLRARRKDDPFSGE